MKIYIFLLSVTLLSACANEPPDPTTQSLMRLRQKYGCSTIMRNSTIDKTLTIGFTQCDSIENIQSDSILYFTAQRLSIDVYKTLIKDQKTPIVYDRIAINILAQPTTIATAAATRQAIFEVKDVAAWAK